MAYSTKPVKFLVQPPKNAEILFGVGAKIVPKKKVKDSISTASGKAFFVRTEKEDSQGKWNDNYKVKDGFYLIHDGNLHHVYRVPQKYVADPEICMTDEQIFEERHGHYYDDR